MAERQRSRIKDQRVLALDIGSRFIKIAEIRMLRGQISLCNIVVSPTPAETVDEGQILDAVALGREIHRLLRENKISTKKVIASVRGQSSVVVRPIELPRMSKKELADTMKFEVERHIPFSADEIVMDYVPLIDPALLPESEENMKVLLAVAQEELINSYISVIRAAKLSPLALDVEILSAIRSLVDLPIALGEPTKTVALINIGASNTDISIIKEGNLLFNRTVRLAGDRLTSAIAEQLGRSLEEAEEIKKEHAQLFLDGFSGELPVPQEMQETATDSTKTTFSFDDLDDDDLPRPVFTFDDDDNLASETPSEPASLTPDDSEATFPPATDSAAPIFSLDDEPVTPATLPADDESEIPAALPADQIPTARPVFDLSSELEEQMPPTLSRPNLPNDADAVTGGMVPATGNQAGADAQLIPFTSNEAKDGSTFSDMPGAPHTADWTRTGGQTDPFKRRVFEAIQPSLEELITEIRRSLEYFTSREPDSPVDCILLYGGTSRLPRLAEYIRHEVGLEVRHADPLIGIDTAPCQMPAEYLQDLAPVLPICIGLGIRDMIA